jgi:drug/metabolite transporter (DMT)-like permease
MSALPAAGTPAGTQTAGILFFFCGLILFGIFDAASKHFVATFPAPFLNVMRYGTVSLVALGLLIKYGFPNWAAIPCKRLMILRGVALGTVGTCFMTALTWMPLAEATAIYFTSPLLVVALSPWVLKEKVTTAKWLAVLAGFGGMLLVVRPGNELPLLGTALMIVASVSFAMFQLLTRQLSGLVASHVQYSSTAFICLIMTAAPAPFFLPDPWPTGTELMLITLVSASNAVAQVLLLAAFLRTPASTLAPFNYFQLLLAVLFSAFLFNQPPDTLALSGIVLIMVAGIFLATRRNTPG